MLLTVKSPSGAIGAGVGDRENRKGDDNIEKRRHDLDIGQGKGENEWRSSGISTRCIEETFIIRGNNQTDDSQGNNIEQRNTPEHLLCRSWQALPWIVCLCSSQADEFGSGEGKTSSDKDGAESLEAVAEGAGVLPVSAANVTTGIGWDTASVDDNTLGEDELSFHSSFHHLQHLHHHVQSL